MDQHVIDPELRTYGTERQGEILAAVNEHGSLSAAALALGINQSNVSRAMMALKMTAMLGGYAPGKAGLEGLLTPVESLKGRSLYHDVATGKTTKVWIKTDVKREAWLEAVRCAIKDDVASLAPRDVEPGPDKNYSTDVIPWLQIGDAHIGMLAHAAETGESFDVRIAERELCSAISHLIDEMPACERMVLNDLGDFTHYENFSGTTEANGHALDFDSRYPKMIKSYRRIMQFIVEKCMTKCQVLDVIINQGNHSRTNDIWMREFLDALYGHTGRVNVLDNSSVFIGYRMGKTFVMTHHSDKCPPARLRTVMTSDFRRDFGETDFHYIDIGHIHHRSVAMDEAGITVESWNHLAASDKWAHEAGYRSSKSITVVLRSKTYGEIGRRTLPIAEVRDRLYGIGHAVPVRKPAFTV